MAEATTAVAEKPPLTTHKQPIRLKPDNRRVIMRPFVLGEARIRTVVNRVRPMAEEQVAELLQGVIGDYSGRHRNIERTLWNNFEEVRPYIEGVEAFSDQRKLLVATFFTMEYAIESAALFNPSMVPGPDQANLQPDEVRVVMSLRATGEGHVSSIEFREAIIAGDGHLAMEPTSRFVAAPALRKDTVYDRHLFRLRVLAMGAPGPPESSEIHGTAFGEQIVDQVLAPLGDRFTFDALAQAIHDYRQQDHSYPAFAEMQLDRMMLLARANYELTFSKDSEISERVVFPVTMHESRGIEDARFVRFVEDDGQIRYLATYTAFDGFNIMSQLLETDDFLQFKVHTLNGRYVNSKGMAFFPRRLHGRYAMISRVDGENLFVMYSDNIHFWDEAEFLRAPEQPWEFMQIGNCGSPLETEAGWLLLTHGVGPMRRYCIGALLLERDNPAHVIGALPWPLLAPDEEEREGYVPNVVYSCGALIHNGWLIIPYAVSDFQTRVASVWLADLLAALTPV